MLAGKQGMRQGIGAHAFNVDDLASQRKQALPFRVKTNAGRFANPAQAVLVDQDFSLPLFEANQGGEYLVLAYPGAGCEFVVEVGQDAGKGALKTRRATSSACAWASAVCRARWLLRIERRSSPSGRADKPRNWLPSASIEALARLVR